MRFIVVFAVIMGVCLAAPSPPGNSKDRKKLLKEIQKKQKSISSDQETKMSELSNLVEKYYGQSSSFTGVICIEAISHTGSTTAKKIFSTAQSVIDNQLDPLIKELKDETTTSDRIGEIKILVKQNSSTVNLIIWSTWTAAVVGVSSEMAVVEMGLAQCLKL